MATQSLIFFLLLSGYALTSATGEDAEFGRPLERNSVDLKEQLTHLRFYWHELLNGSNATSVEVIHPLPSYNNSSKFGSVAIFDDPLTLGPELSSKLVGRAEGLYAATSQTEFDLLAVQSFAFFEGKYNGSAITVLGRNLAFNETRELPVVGGSGVFRFAKGYAQLRTHSFDAVTRTTVVEYNVYVSHY